MGVRPRAWSDNLTCHAGFHALSGIAAESSRVPINGDAPILRRQEIVNLFQRHLPSDGGFDMLILGPKSAGTGLTLTAATHVIHLSR